MNHWIALKNRRKQLATGNRRQGNRTRLGLERLESRRMLAGELDPDFHGDGILTRDLFAVPTGVGQANAVVVQPDGKIISAGIVSSGKGALSRLNPDGSFDTTWPFCSKIKRRHGGLAPRPLT